MAQQHIQKVQITARSLVFIVLVFYGVDLSLKFLKLNVELIFAVMLAFILMSGLKPFVHKLEDKNVPRPIAAALVFLSAMSFFIGITAFVIPTIITESILFLKNLPEILVKAFPFIENYFNPDAVIQFLPNITSNAVKVATGIFSNFLFVVTVSFFTFYFLLEEVFLQSFLSWFLDTQRARKVVLIVRKVETRMGAWLRGQLILMTVIGVMTYIALSLLGIPFALTLAVLAGLLEIIPIIGPIISAVPAFLVAASTSLWLGGATVSLYVVIQQLENNIIVPYVMNKAVGIHPITTLIALTIGAKLGGVVGAILAVPVALLIETVASELLKKES